MPGKRFPKTQQDALQSLLRQVRLDAGLTQVELSKKLGQPQSHVSKYESGERRLDVLELHELCLAAGITLPKFAERLDQLLAGRRRGSG